MDRLELSTLGKTWLIDLDGSVFEHNSHLSGKDKLLPGVKQFWDETLNRDEDTIILLTARDERFREQTIASLRYFELEFSKIIFGLPTGERICINDRKPSGLTTSYAINVERNNGLGDISIHLRDDL